MLPTFVLLPLLLGLAAACDCQTKWKTLTAPEASALKMGQLDVINLASWDTSDLGIRQACIQYSNNGSGRAGQVHFNTNVGLCDGYATSPDGDAILFYVITDEDAEPDTTWQSGRTFYTFDRYSSYKCYNHSFDAFHYYFHSGLRDVIDEFDCPFPPIEGSVSGCCFFDQSTYSCTGGQIKNCDPARPCIDPEDVYEVDIHAVPATMDYAHSAWGSARLADVVTRFYQQFGRTYGLVGLNPSCDFGQVTIYEPDTQCASVRWGCVHYPCNSTASASTPPCNGNGYCVSGAGRGAGFPPYRCECLRYGDIPAWQLSAWGLPSDYNLDNSPKHEGVYKYIGYGCQTPEPYVQCADRGAGSDSLCGLTTGGSNYCRPYYFWSDCSSSTPSYPGQVGDFYNSNLKCDCSGLNYGGTYCTESRCMTYNNTYDPSACGVNQGRGSCTPDEHNVFSCVCAPAYTGLTCELSSAPCVYNGLMCAGHGFCTYDHTKSNQTSVHCDCSPSGGLASGQWCELVTCDPQQIWPGRGHCEGDFAWHSDSQCYKGPEDCGPGESYECHQIFQSSSGSPPPPLHCDVDVCAKYGGTGYVPWGSAFGTCNCSASYSLQGSVAPSNYILKTAGNIPLIIANNPLCFPRCINNCAGGSGLCMVSIVNGSVPYVLPTHYSNCACPTFIPGSGTGCVTVTHPELVGVLGINPPPNELPTSTDPYCFNGGTWHGIGVQCTCTACYTGLRCETLACQHGATCPSGSSCVCSGPWTGSVCSVSTCDNPSTAFVEGYFETGTNTCFCNDPYDASTQANLDCATYDCGHGTLSAFIEMVDIEYRCDCTSPWLTVCTNGYCEYCNYEACDLLPCANGGTCTPSGSSYTCTCVAGYGGPQCTVDVNDCAPNPCQNGGTCTDGLDTFTCQCAPGWSGTSCATNVNECASSPCRHGGSCVDGVNSFRCSCVEPYYGTTCQSQTIACLSAPCQHGGTCTEDEDSFVCACVDGWSGTVCSTQVDECASSPCMNGGVCVDGQAGFSCTCAEGWSGSTCNTTVPIPPAVPVTESKGMDAVTITIATVAGAVAVAATVVVVYFTVKAGAAAASGLAYAPVATS